MDAETAIGGGIGLILGLLIVIVFGAIIGWLASLVVRGAGLGLWGHVAVGIVGSFLAGFVLPRIGIGNPESIIVSVIFSVLGAIILLLIVRAVRRH